MPDPFVSWVLGQWRRDLFPQWQLILWEAEATEDTRRRDYARWMLSDVLREA